MTCLLAAIGMPFIPSAVQLRPFVVELWLLGAIVAVLICPFFTSRPNRPSGLIALAGLVLALIFEVITGPTLGGVAVPVGLRMVVADPVAVFWKVILLIFVIGVVLMWFSTTAQEMQEGDGPEFFALLLGATTGLSLMGCLDNLLLLLVAVELASLSSYVLAGFRKTNRLGSEASLKYVLFGTACSAIMAYGLSMLYGLYGTLQIPQIAHMAAMGTGGLPLWLGLGGLLVGLGFKISLVPLHWWCPDVFEGAGVDVSAFLSVASKGAGLVLLMRVLQTLGAAAAFAPSQTTLVTLAWIVGILGAVTATAGNTGAFVQGNIKRLLAYSSIAHAGYMLCALSLLVRHNITPMHADGESPVAQAILVYLAVYLFMNLGAFTVAAVIYRQTGSEQIKDYAGLGRRSPMLALCMAAFLVSLVGLPPLGGFVAKLNIMMVLGSNGGWWWGLVAVIGLNTVLSLYYYIGIAKVMYLEDTDQPSVTANPVGLAVCMVCALVLVAMFIGFNPLLKLAGDYGWLQWAMTPATAIRSAPGL